LLHDEVENVDLEITPNTETNKEAIQPEPHPIEPQIQAETVNDNDEVYEEPARARDTTAPAALPEPATAPEEIPGVCRSTRVKFPAKQGYVPSISGSSKYAYAVTQLESQGALHPDSHMFFHQEMHQEEPDVVSMIMTQLSLKAGLEQWGTKAEAAARSEMKQLHFRDTFKPCHWKDLTRSERMSVLESHMFLKEKRDGEAIKGRTVAGGNKQRDCISKEEASSPTVATESASLTCVVDAEEGRDVAVIDTPNAFIQTRIDDKKDMVFIKIRGVLVDMLVDVAPDVYKPHVTTDKKGTKQSRTMPERHLWNNGGEPALLPQVLQEFDKQGVRVEPMRSMRGEQDHQGQANDCLLPCERLQTQSHAIQGNG
jgi:hypothetical protein